MRFYDVQGKVVRRLHRSASRRFDQADSEVYEGNNIVTAVSVTDMSGGYEMIDDALSRISICRHCFKCRDWRTWSRVETSTCAASLRYSHRPYCETV